MTLIERVTQLRALIEEIMSGVEDSVASRGAELYPRMNYDGALIKAGTRICWQKIQEDNSVELIVMKATVDLWDTLENNPDNAPDLWEELEYRNGVRIIPDTITVTSAFAKDELGYWGDILYVSKVNNNTYTPDQYADNWEMVKTV